MDFARQLIELLIGYAVRWRTRGGFLRIAVVLIAGTAVVARSVPVSIIVTVYACAVVVVLWVVIWAIGSGRIPIPRTGTTVVFAVDVDVEAERNFRRIFAMLKTEIDSLELTQPIRLRRIASDLVDSKRAAAEYSKNFVVDQVVWGTALAGKIHNEKIQSFDIRYHHRVSEELGLDIKRVMADVKTLAYGRTWNIREVEELIDVRVVAEDFLELSLGIIGIMLFVTDQLEDAAVVFARVVVGLERHAGLNPTAERHRQIDRFRELLSDVRITLAVQAHDRDNHEQAIALLRAVLAKAPNDLNALTLMARCYYYLDNRARAIAYTEQIRNIDPQNPVALSNLAFFALLQKDYERAGQWYDEFMASDDENADYVASSASEFLEERFDENPTEYGYLYALAILNDRTDSSLMCSDLAGFVRATEGDAAYEPLRTRAKALLAKNAG